MSLDDIYMMLRELKRKMYQERRQEVTLSQAEFFAVYQTICFMMQIKHITDAQG